MLAEESEDEHQITSDFKGLFYWNFSNILITTILLCAFQKNDNWLVELLTDFNTAFPPATNLT